MYTHAQKSHHFLIINVLISLILSLFTDSIGSELRCQKNLISPLQVVYVTFQPRFSVSVGWSV